MDSDTILETTDLTKSFGGFLAVRGVSMKVRRGTVHALIGPNGAGKTTCFNLLTHFLAPSAGHIYFNGRDITGSRPAAIARLGLVRSFQISAVFPDLSALENVCVALQRRRRHSFDFWTSIGVLKALEERARELIDLVGLSGFADAKAGAMAYGRKRLLEFATTLALDPQMLLLDEPTAGMTQEGVVRITELIRKIAADKTVLMVEHNLSVVSSLSDRITVLARGEVLAEGDYDAVSNNADVRRAYLGTAAHV